MRGHRPPRLHPDPAGLSRLFDVHFVSPRSALSEGLYGVPLSKSETPPGCHRSLGSGGSCRFQGAVVPVFSPSCVTSIRYLHTLPPCVTSMRFTFTITFGSLPAWYPPCPPPPMIVRQMSEGRCTHPRWLKLFPGITSFTFLLLYNNVRLSSPTLCGHDGRSKGVYCVDIPRVVASRTPVEITESLFAVHPEAPFLRLAGQPHRASRL